MSWTCIHLKNQLVDTMCPFPLQVALLNVLADANINNKAVNVPFYIRLVFSAFYFNFGGALGYISYYSTVVQRVYFVTLFLF